MNASPHTRSRVLAIAMMLLGAVLAGCASTEIVSSWRDPAFTPAAFRKVLVVFQHPDPALRRSLENAMAAEIAQSTPAHAVFSDEEVRDIDRVKAKVREMGFDGTVIMRVVAVERETSLEPRNVHAWPGYYRHLWGYWGWGWGMVYEPYYLRTDRIVKVATHVYSVPDDKLVWASQSETFNPSSLRDAIVEVVRITSRATGDALRTRG